MWLGGGLSRALAEQNLERSQRAERTGEGLEHRDGQQKQLVEQLQLGQPSWSGSLEGMKLGRALNSKQRYRAVILEVTGVLELPTQRNSMIRSRV